MSPDSSARTVNLARAGRSGLRFIPVIFARTSALVAGLADLAIDLCTSPLGYLELDVKIDGRFLVIGKIHQRRADIFQVVDQGRGKGTVLQRHGEAVQLKGIKPERPGLSLGSRFLSGFNDLALYHSCDRWVPASHPAGFRRLYYAPRWFHRRWPPSG